MSKPGLFLRILTRSALSGRPAWLAAILRRRIACSTEWQAHYEAERQREHQESEALSAGQLRSIEAGVFAELDLLQRPRARIKWVLVPTVATAAAVLLLVTTSSTETWDLRERGGDEVRFGLTARCLDADESVVLAEEAIGPMRSGAVLRCPRDGKLGFSATNLEDREMHVFLFGLAGRDEIRWYAPFVPPASSMVVPPGAIDSVFDEVAGLEGMPLDERVSLFVLFSDRPVHADDIRRAAGSELASPGADRLPIPIAHQARLELRFDE